MSALPPDYKVAQDFLDALEPGGTFSFVTFDDNKTRDDQSLVRTFHGTLSEWFDTLVEFNVRGAGVFVEVNRNNGNSTENADVTGVRAWFVDGDEMARPERWHLTPNIISWRDDTHWHAYWLADPFGDNLAGFRDAQKRLIKHYGTDSKIHNLARIMRLPGFNHCKREPVQYRVEVLPSKHCYEQSELCEGLPELELPVAPKRPDAQPASNGRVSVDVLMRKALKGARGGRNDGGFHLACQLRDNRYTQTEAEAVLRDYAACVPQYDLNGRPAAYHLNEALNSVRQAYSEPAREPWPEKRRAHTGKRPTHEPKGGKTEAGPTDSKAAIIPNTSQTAPSKIEGEEAVSALPSGSTQRPEQNQTNGLEIDIDVKPTAPHPVTDQGRTAKQFGIQMDTTCYTISEMGVFPIKYAEGAYQPNMKSPISRTPIWIDAKGYDAHGTMWMRLNWHRTGEAKHTQWVSEQTIKSRDALLAIPGAPISLGRVNALSDFLQDCTKYIIQPAARVAPHVGWNGNEWSWPGHNSELHYIGKALPEPGSLDEWTKGFALLCEFAEGGQHVLNAIFVLALSVASPFVRNLGKRRPILGLVEESSTGKGTAIRFGLSVWMQPENLTVPADSTVKGVQDKTVAMPDLPFFIDDLQQIDERDPRAVADMMYFLGNGQRRITSSRSQEAKGGEQRFGSVFYAAERPLQSGSNLGAQNRAIEIGGAPLPEDAVAQTLADATRKGAGALALPMAKIINDEWGQIVDQIHLEAARAEVTGTLRGDDRYVVALIGKGIELLGRITGIYLKPEYWRPQLLEIVSGHRVSAVGKEVDVLETMIERVLKSGDWKTKTDRAHPSLEIYSEIVACYSKTEDGLLVLDLNHDSRFCGEVRRDLGVAGFRKMFPSWAKNKQILPQGKSLTVVSKGIGGRAIRIAPDFLKKFKVEADAKVEVLFNDKG